MQGCSDVTDRIELLALRPLTAYAEALRAARASAALDERIAALIRASSSPPESSGGRLHQVMASVAAGSAALLIAALVLWIVRNEHAKQSTPEKIPVASVAEPLRDDTHRTQDAHASFSVLPTGQYSLWPTDASVLRVRARLGATATLAPDGEVTDERRYWVDVRIANDGSMRIVRVVPADTEWVEENEQ
jgi:hypothetical protein